MSRRSVLGVVVGTIVVLGVIAFSSAGERSEVASAPARPGDGGSAAPAVGGSEAGLVTPGQGVTVERALVRTAQLVVEVADPAVAMREVRAVATGAGGVVTQEQSGDAGVWAVLRVPAEGLDRLVEQVSRVGTVIDRGSTVVDATEEVVDLDARVASMQASVSRVRALLAEATSVGDVVAVESELARREAELDSLTGRLAALRDQVAMSTLTVELRVPGSGVEEPGFLAGVRAGWDGLRMLGAGVGFVLPFLPVLAALGGLVWLARRRRRGGA